MLNRFIKWFVNDCSIGTGILLLGIAIGYSGKAILMAFFNLFNL